MSRTLRRDTAPLSSKAKVSMRPKAPQKQETWLRSNQELIFYTLSFVWILIVYWRAIFNPFSSYDDLTNIVNNSGLSSWSGIIYYLHSNVSLVGDLRGSGQSYYRPIFWISLALDRKLWGLSPVAFHLTNLVLHWLNGLLLFTVLKRARVSHEVAACTALVWLALPINSEVVAWISARAYLLAAFFILIGALLAQLILEKQRPLLFGGYGIAALCAIFSHEAGILLLPLIVLIALAMKKPRARSAFALYSIAISTIGLYFWITHLIGPAGQYRQPVAVAPFGIFFFKYLTWLVLPIHMSMERSTNTPMDTVSTQAIVAWIAAMSIFAAVIVIRRKWPMIAAALAWMSVGLLPFCGLVPIYQGMAERFLYFASMGLAFLVAALCFSVPPQTRSLVLSILAVWILWGTWRLHRRLIDWSDPILLYQSSLQASPGSTRLLYNVGALSEQQGDLARAELSYRSAIRIQPDLEQAISGLANVRLRENAPKEAAELYKRALSIKPDDAPALANYAVSLQELGDLPNAAAQYRRAIALAPPKDDVAYCGLGVLLFQEGDLVEASIQFLNAQKIAPSDPTPYYDLGSVYQKLGKPDAAANQFRKALELNPGDADTIKALHALESR
jgi:protein O-mannosyl-transferase